VLFPLLGELPPKILPPAAKNSSCVKAIKIYISNKVMKNKNITALTHLKTGRHCQMMVMMTPQIQMCALKFQNQNYNN
jgi:hypothetical protein